MQATIGIDVGGSTTKIVGFRHLPDGRRELISPLYVRATDPVTSAYGAFGKFTALSHLELSDIRRVLVTGVGSSAIGNSLYNLPCSRVEEFVSIGRGGLFLSGLDEAIVVSMGTGTALVHAKSDGTATYLGGTGVGGGIMRDLFTGSMPYIFVKHFYATACIAGSIVCVILWQPAGRIIAMLSGTFTVIILRFLAAHFRWNLPHVPTAIDAEKREKNVEHKEKIYK